MTESPNFPDHFSQVADGYRWARPAYPDALLRYIAGFAEPEALVLDCAAGSGQLSAPLQSYFPTLVACDASRPQLAQLQARSLPRVQCQVEALPFGENSFTMVTVAQAVHWFDFSAFETEMLRVLVPGGVLVLVGYGLLSTDCARANELIYHYYNNVLADFWPEPRRWIDQAYTDLPINLPAQESRTFKFCQTWEVERLLAYLGTWSATSRLLDAGGESQFRQVAEAIRGIGQPQLQLTWPVFTRVFRIP